MIFSRTNKIINTFGDALSPEIQSREDGISRLTKQIPRFYPDSYINTTDLKLVMGSSPLGGYNIVPGGVIRVSFLLTFRSNNDITTLRNETDLAIQYAITSGLTVLPDNNITQNVSNLPTILRLYDNG